MELPMTFNEEELWSRTLLLYDAALREINTKLEILNNEFKQTHQYNPIEHITSRIKSPQSIAKKMRHNQREMTVENVVKYINDIAGIRIICSFTNDIYRIAEMITRQNDITVLKIKDYIRNPKANGYMSYHMIVSVPIFLSDEVIDTKVEIQIRTIAMDFWASLEHKIYYKFEGNTPDHITRELKECADLVAFLDRKMLAINDEVQSYKQPEEDYSRYITNMLKARMKDAYGKVLDENNTIDAEEKTIDIVEETVPLQESEPADTSLAREAEQNAAFRVYEAAAGDVASAHESQQNASFQVYSATGDSTPVQGEMLGEIAKQIIKENDKVPFNEHSLMYSYVG